MTAQERWRGRYLAVRERDGWEHVTRVQGSGVVGVVAVTDDGCIVLVEQRRPPVEAAVIELPAGLVGDRAEEDPLVAAQRELSEETGFSASVWTLVADGPSSAGLTDEHVQFWLARGLVREHDGGGDASEEITVHVVPLASAQDWLRAARARGARIDHKVLVGLWLAGVPWDGRSLAG